MQQTRTTIAGNVGIQLTDTNGAALDMGVAQLKNINYKRVITLRYSAYVQGANVGWLTSLGKIRRRN